MRWCRFQVPGDHAGARCGILDGDDVVAVDGTPFGWHRRTRQRLPLEQVRLLPPVMPGTFFCVGLNYVSHTGAHGMTAPQRPEVGYRANSALIGPGAPIVRPADCTGRFEAEGELVAVIGRRLRRCTRQEAADAVFGWTIGNDVSVRDWQHRDRTLWRAKNSDTFKPMGPWIETDADPTGARTVVEVDGAVRADFATGDMLFSPVDYLCEIARYITITPGDVLWMGTDAVVGIQPGDAVSITITGIGTLTNPVEQETPPTAAEEER